MTSTSARSVGGVAAASVGRLNGGSAPSTMLTLPLKRFAKKMQVGK